MLFGLFTWASILILLLWIWVYASCKCVRLGLNPLTTSLCVMSRKRHRWPDFWASSPVFKQVFGKKMSRSYDLPLWFKTRNLIATWGCKDCQRIHPLFLHWISNKRTDYSSPMNATFRSIWKFVVILQNLCTSDDIFPYWLTKALSNWPLPLNYFNIPDPSLSRKEKLTLFLPESKKDLAETGIYFYRSASSNANPFCQASLERSCYEICGSNWSYEDVERCLETAPAHWFLKRLGRRTESDCKRSGSLYRD